MVKDILLNGNGGWVGAVTRLGLPVVLALALTSFLIFRVDAALTQVQKSVDVTSAHMDRANQSMSVFAQQQADNQRIYRNIALQTCLNTAKSETATQACLRAAEK